MGEAMQGPEGKGMEGLRDHPLADIPWAIVDVETTGLSPETGDRVVEVALLRVEPGEPPRLFRSLVHPGRPMDPAASRVNGIRDADLRGQPPFVALAPGLIERIRGAALVAHNAPFDLGFLTHELGRSGLRLPEVPVIDTLQLARRNFNFRSNSLGNIARTLGISIQGAHRAGADVQITYGVLRHMLAELEAKGIRSLAEVLAAQGMAGQGAPPPSLPEPLATAFRERLPILIAYRSQGRSASRRVIEPIGQRGAHLIAYCRLRKGERTFRIDRIEGAWWPPAEDS
jgi:DNA polymerase-3 subunit epsilon